MNPTTHDGTVADRPKTFTEKGLWFPTMLGLGLGVMVLWNMFFIYKALETAPEVRSDYTHAIER